MNIVKSNFVLKYRSASSTVTKYSVLLHSQIFIKNWTNSISTEQTWTKTRDSRVLLNRSWPSKKCYFITFHFTSLKIWIAHVVDNHRKSKFPSHWNCTFIQLLLLQAFHSSLRPDFTEKKGLQKHITILMILWPTPMHFRLCESSESTTTPKKDYQSGSQRLQVCVVSVSLVYCTQNARVIPKLFARTFITVVQPLKCYTFCVAALHTIDNK